MDDHVLRCRGIRAGFFHREDGSKVVCLGIDLDDRLGSVATVILSRDELLDLVNTLHQLQTELERKPAAPSPS